MGVTENANYKNHVTCKYKRSPIKIFIFSSKHKKEKKVNQI